jgi:hypothetical protein
MGLPLDLFVLVATVVYVVVGLAVGVRLLRLARRTRGFPELVLGLGECLLAGVVPPFFTVVQVAPGPEWLLRGADFVGQLAYTIGCAVMILFTWRVFRPGEGWARVLVYAALAVLGLGGGLGMSRSFLASDPAELRTVQTFAFLVMEWISLVGFFWTAGEAFLHHARLRKQWKLGLTDVVVVNRMFLWAIVGVGGVVAAGGPVAVSLAGIEMATHPPTRLLCAFATLASSVAIQLAILPPAAYLRWVRSAVAR